jgi:two-component system chemotaxis response regulator CheB
MELERRITSMDETTPENVEKLGHPSFYSCLECEGPLWQIQDEEVPRLRCLVGRACTAESVLAGKSEALEEGAQMSRRLAADSRARGHEYAAARSEERVRKTRRQAALIRQALSSGTPDATEDVV